MNNSGQPLDPAIQEAIEQQAKETAQEAHDKLAEELQARARAKAAKAAAPAAVAEPVVPPAAPIQPGVERWPVKTGTDPDTGTVQASGNPTTVEDLLMIERPDDIPFTQDNPAFQDHRSAPTEETIFTLPSATIIGYKIETDGDYHIVIQGDSGHTMIVEIPDPDPAFVGPSSPFAAQIAAARQSFDTQFAANPPQPFLQKANQSAQITGVGFFDRMHGQTGVAQTNGIELHPVLAITFPAG